jgi:hypothetical protein
MFGGNVLVLKSKFACLGKLQCISIVFKGFGHSFKLNFTSQSNCPHQIQQKRSQMNKLSKALAYINVLSILVDSAMVVCSFDAHTSGQLANMMTNPVRLFAHNESVGSSAHNSPPKSAST